MNIFENGYLKPEFINPNYRGLVGWKDNEGRILILVDEFDEDEAIVTDYIYKGAGPDFSGRAKIPQFTPADIPAGELCWYRVTDEDGDKEYWTLQSLPNAEESLVYSGVPVPYLIAETAERAEELKDWSR